MQEASRQEFAKDAALIRFRKSLPKIVVEKKKELCCIMNKATKAEITKVPYDKLP